MSNASSPRARYGRDDDGQPTILTPEGHTFRADDLTEQIASLSRHLSYATPSVRLILKKRIAALEKQLSELTRMAPTPAEVAENLLSRMSPDEALTRINRVAWCNAGGDWRKVEYTHQLNEVGRLILIADAAQAQAQEEQAA